MSNDGQDRFGGGQPAGEFGVGADQFVLARLESRATPTLISQGGCKAGNSLRTAVIDGSGARAGGGDRHVPDGAFETAAEVMGVPAHPILHPVSASAAAHAADAGAYKHGVIDGKLTPAAKRAKKSHRELRMTRDRVARWREAKGQFVPDTRRIDMSVSEALAVHAATLPPDLATALLREVVRLATDGLTFKGYDRKEARKAVAKRLVTWTSGTPHSGSVRAAKRVKILTTTVTP